MRNNYMTWKQFQCPLPELACILYPVTTTAKLTNGKYAGEKIFVSDMTANDGSTGVEVSWHPGTKTWKKLY